MEKNTPLYIRHRGGGGEMRVAPLHGPPPKFYKFRTQPIPPLPFQKVVGLEVVLVGLWRASL